MFELTTIKILGEGAQGEVWRCLWQKEGRDSPVAVKKIVVQGDLQKRIAEAQILMMFQHPNIARVFCTEAQVKTVYIVMECLPGGSLYDLLHSELVIDWDTRLRLAHQAAIAVNVLHSQNPPVIHRDIKSLNFMISQDCTSVKLIDFGLALMSANLIENPDGKAVGTIRWQAPETFSKPIVWTPKVDIYSLALTFYEIATLQIPFEEIADQSRVVNIIQRLKKRPQIPAECPKDFAQLIEECWAQDPEKRPSSAQLVAKLETILANRGLASSIDPIPTLMAFNYAYNELRSKFGTAFNLVDNVTTIATIPDKHKMYIKVCPVCVVWNPRGNYFYVSGNHFIKTLSPEGKFSSYIKDEKLEFYSIVVYHKENTIFGANRKLQAILRISDSGNITVFAGGTQGYRDGQGTQAQFDNLAVITIDQQTGNIFVSDCENRAIRKIDPQGNVTTIGTTKYNVGFLCFDHISQSLFYADAEEPKIKQVLLTGEICAEFSVQATTAIAVNEEGYLFFTCIITHSIYVAIKRGLGEFKVMRLAGTGEATTKDGKADKCSFLFPFGLVVQEGTNSICVIEEDGPVRKIQLL